jgi:hypothetical protein
MQVKKIITLSEDFSTGRAVIDSTNHKLYIDEISRSLSIPSFISVIDTVTDEIIDTISAPDFNDLAVLFIDAIHNKLYLQQVTGGITHPQTIFILDTNTYEVIGSIPKLFEIYSPAYYSIHQRLYFSASTTVAGLGNPGGIVTFVDSNTNILGDSISAPFSEEIILTIVPLCENSRSTQSSSSISALSTSKDCPPKANAGRDQIGKKEGDPITLNGAGSKDPEGKPLEYLWTQTKGPVITRIAGVNTAIAQFRMPKLTGDQHAISFTLTVTDKAGQKDSDSVDIKDRSTQCITESHIHLKKAPWASSPSRELEDALQNADADFQIPIKDPLNPIKYDDYEINIKSLPPGTKPIDLLNEMLLKGPNSVANNPTFDANSKFVRRSDSPTANLGDIYDIHFPLRQEGSVMLVEKTDTHFTLQTITTPEAGAHPVSGAREFGYETNSDGSITFYTRGADQAAIDILGHDAAGLDAFTEILQGRTWDAFFEGLSADINKHGGSSDIGTFNKWVIKLPVSQDPNTSICVKK